ncbi:MAG: pyridoxamine 5'-phosphate oxidase family protein [Alphaproteobacteria bacterium]|nr:pyridoxamine 5'-phosphate oxidase family protein [Alphaproteobacteria bacterium]
MGIETIGNKEALRAQYGTPSERAVKKQLARLDKHCRNFIALSPFLVVATAGRDGLGDASPRGDAPGFVAVLDDTTLLIPDRPGNNRIDTLQNLVDRPGIGLIFFVPGINETLRVNGEARITTDPALLAPLAMQGKVPRSGILVAVKEAYLHCAKALIRAQLWDPTRHVERRTFPTLGRIIVDQIGEGDVAATESAIEDAYRSKLY